MKPCKMWTVVNQFGGVSMMDKVACMFANRKDAKTWSIGTESPLRVRVLEDAAVERAIEALTSALEPCRYACSNEVANKCRAAIRDLGGRP